MALTPPLASREHQVRILHVDDEPDFSALTAEFLERADERIDVLTATGAEDALSTLDAESVECVVSDYDMPGRNGIELLSLVREQYPDLPFILFTGKGSEEIASDAISAGVTDYLQKGTGTDQYDVLANRIVNVVERYRAATDLQRQTEQHRVVADLGRRAIEREDLDALFEEAVSLVATSLECPFAELLERRLDDDLVVVAGTGWDADTVETTSVPLDGDSQFAYALDCTAPVVTDDFRSEARFDGSELLTEAGVVGSIAAVVGTVGEPFGVLGVHSTEPRAFSDHDVTFVQNVANVLGAAIDRHEVERRRRESEERFREIAELSPDGIFRIAPDGIFEYVSPAAAKLLATDAETLAGMFFETFLTAESRESALFGFGRVLEGETVRGLELTLVDGDGERWEAAVSASPVFREGEVALVQGFARDVTDSKAAERDLWQSRERYRSLVEHFPDGAVFMIDDDLRFTLAGGTELDVFGYRPAEVTGKRPTDVFPASLAEETEEYLQLTLTGETHTFEQTYEGRTYRVRTIPIRGPDNAVDQAMAVAQRVRSADPSESTDAD